MICITGDVHDRISHSWEQERIGGNDLGPVMKYLEILKKYKLKCTLFINGILLDKYPEKIKEILKYDVELGGHTYNNFRKMNIFKSYIYRKLFGCIYGSKSYQKRDIRKTKKAFEKFGLKMNSWRTHAFASNNLTFDLLRKTGVMYVSDLLGEQKPFEENKIIHMPINIPVDQNTIAFGELTPENRCPFASCTKGRIKPEEWFGILKKRIKENERGGIVSVLLIHPLTMNVLDDFKMFKEIVKFLSKYKSVKLSEFKI